MKFSRILLLLLLVTGLRSMGLHKFYVAVFQLNHVPEKNVVQMTSRLFIDDIEVALNTKYKKKFYLGSSRELPEADKYLKEYLDEKIQVKINGVAEKIKFLGRELEDDILICYYTIPAGKAITSIEMSNKTLFDYFPGQQNIIHTNINRNKKSLLLTNDKPAGTLKY